MNVKRALISVYNKDGIVDFAKKLIERRVEIISTGGTYKILSENDVPVISIENYTGFPEILDGRVKTINPKIVGGILADRNNVNHIQNLVKYNIPEIDLVVINLKPFEEVAKLSRNENELLKNIDIGGLNLLRSAAKNYRDVIPLVDPLDYSDILESLDNCGDVTLQDRRYLALKAFYKSMRYDSSIHSTLSLMFAQEKYENFTLERLDDLRYGENPHQESYLTKIVEKNSMTDNIRFYYGRMPTYNSYLDLFKAIQLASELEENCSVVIRHRKPLFVLSNGKNIGEQDYYYNKYKDNLKGGVFLYNGRLDVEYALLLKDLKFDTISAKSYTDNALALLKDSNTFCISCFNFWDFSNWEYYYLDGGFLVQERDKKQYIGKIECVGENKPKEDIIKDLELAFIVSKHSSSDSMVAVKGGKTIGIGCGQILREDAFDVMKSHVQKCNFSLQGAAIASDGFISDFDFLENILKNNLSGLILPGKSKIDDKIIHKANEYNTPLLVMSRRHFSK